VTLYPSQEVNDIPPIFQVVQLPEFYRKLRLIVDSASPITFVNSKTWLDLDKPNLQPTTHVLGAFEGQPIHPVGYFETKMLRDDAIECGAILQIYMSHRMALTSWVMMDSQS